jgi:hypothetical protein
MTSLPDQTHTHTPLLTSSFTKPIILIPELNINFDIDDKIPQKKKGKKCCSFEDCKKKLSLTDFPCKCGLVHCSEHRPSEVHNCSYDYRGSHNSFLMKTMDTAIIAKKIDQI